MIKSNQLLIGFFYLKPMQEQLTTEEYRQLLSNATDRQVGLQLGNWRAQFVAEETPKILHETGLSHKNKVQITSPFRNENNPSFSMALKDDSFVFHDFGSSDLSGGGAVQFRYIQIHGHKPTKEDEERFLIDEGLNRNYERLLTSGMADPNKKEYKDPVQEYRRKQIALFDFLQDNNLMHLSTPNGFPDKPYLKKVEFDLAEIQKIYPTAQSFQSALKDFLKSEFNSEKFGLSDDSNLSYSIANAAFSGGKTPYLAVFNEDLKIHNLYNGFNGMLDIPLHRFDNGVSLTPLNFDNYMRDKTTYNISDGSKKYHDREQNDVVRHKELNNLDLGELLVTADVAHYRKAISDGTPTTLIPRGFYTADRNHPNFVFDADKTPDSHIPLSRIMRSVYGQANVGRIQLDLFQKEKLSQKEYQAMVSSMKFDTSHYNEAQLDYLAQYKQNSQWLAVSLSQMPKDRVLNAYRFNNKESDDLITYFLNQKPISKMQIENKKLNFLASLNGVASRAIELANKNLALSEEYLQAEKGQRKILESKGAQKNYRDIYDNVMSFNDSVKSLSKVYTAMFDKNDRAAYQTAIWSLGVDEKPDIPPRAMPYIARKPQYTAQHQLSLDANEAASKLFQSQRQAEPYLKFVESRNLEKYDSQGVRIDEKFGLGFGYGDEFNKAFNSITGRALNSSYGSKENLQGHGQYFSRDGEKKGMFVERITFPVKDEFGQTVAFGARRTKEDGSEKYINSKTPEETKAIFNKNQVFYGLYESKNAINKSNEIIITEGYMDCIASHVAGVENAVATMGTGLGAEKLLKAAQYADNIKIVLDGDRAGLSAMDKSILPSVLQVKDNQPLVYSPDRKISFVNLPNGLDPDEHINKYGADDYKDKLKKAVPVEDYAIIATYRSVFLLNKNYEPLSETEQLKRQSDPIFQARFKEQLEVLLKDIKEQYPNVAKQITEKSDKVIDAFNATKGMSINTHIDKSFDELSAVFIREQKQEFNDLFKQILYPRIAKDMQDRYLETILNNNTQSKEENDKQKQINERTLSMTEQAMSYKSEIVEPELKNKMVMKM